ncbi:ArsR/SmtB family transcription factor [Endomicrobium proavitum]|uniref:Transcriptional regulator, ArsR family n=1 Tax=Endomicrobium proavitum TaxID=1408281 RepID=A0A0G3WJ59_9BACT|nr:metalloregulator ArsR/SmtB family transcription factor [Endomicrobium proavitum]AKL98363.1 Transcriptional regulator, ArsR family [Endomicrobium proavitum]
MAKSKDALICDCKVIHKHTVTKVKRAMPREEKLYDLAEFFKIFGDSTRIKILCALVANEMCVCDLAALLNMTKSSISHQLRILKQARLVKYRKEGKIVFYCPCDEHIQKIFNEGFNHINE